MNTSGDTHSPRYGFHGSANVACPTDQMVVTNTVAAPNAPAVPPNRRASATVATNATTLTIAAPTTMPSRSDANRSGIASAHDTKGPR